MGLRSRLHRLENSFSCIAQCSGCGFGSEWSKVEIEVEWAEGNTESEENEHCPECGRLLLVVVKWADEP